MKHSLTLVTALLLAPRATLHASDAPTPRGGEKVIVYRDAHGIAVVAGP